MYFIYIHYININIHSATTHIYNRFMHIFILIYIYALLTHTHTRCHTKIYTLIYVYGNILDVCFKIFIHQYTLYACMYTCCCSLVFQPAGILFFQLLQYSSFIDLSVCFFLSQSSSKALEKYNCSTRKNKQTYINYQFIQ